MSKDHLKDTRWEQQKADKWEADMQRWQELEEEKRLNPQERFLRDLKWKYPSGTQFNLFAHLGYGNELKIKIWDARRDALKWKCDPEEYAAHLSGILTSDLPLLKSFRGNRRRMRHQLRTCIWAYVWEELGICLYDLSIKVPYDEKIHRQIAAYLHRLPADQQAIRVTIV